MIQLIAIIVLGGYVALVLAPVWHSVRRLKEGKPVSRIGTAYVAAYHHDLSKRIAPSRRTASLAPDDSPPALRNNTTEMAGSAS
jgi:hypothetical protein